MSDPEIDDAISRMAEVDQTQNGNCGVFAVALANVFPGGVFVGVTATGRDPVNGFTHFDHVAYEIDGVLYDGSGAIDEATLRSWCREEPQIVRIDPEQDDDAYAKVLGGCGDNGTDPEDFEAALDDEVEPG